MRWRAWILELCSIKILRRNIKAKSIQICNNLLPLALYDRLSFEANLYYRSLPKTGALLE